MNQLRKNIITLNILSNRPVEEMDIDHILEEANEGDMILQSIEVSVIRLDKNQMRRELELAGADKDFFDEDDS